MFTLSIYDFHPCAKEPEEIGHCISIFLLHPSIAALLQWDLSLKTIALSSRFAHDAHYRSYSVIRRTRLLDAPQT